MPRPRKDGEEPKYVPRPEVVLDGSLPAQLAACRASMEWHHTALPDHPAVRLYVQLRRKNMHNFEAKWLALEREWREEQKAASGVAGAVFVSARNGGAEMPKTPPPDEREEDVLSLIGELISLINGK